MYLTDILRQFESEKSSHTSHFKKQYCEVIKYQLMDEFLTKYVNFGYCILNYCNFILKLFFRKKMST